MDKAKNHRVAFVLLLCAVGAICGLVIFVGMAWWQSQNRIIGITSTEQIKFTSIAWSTGNANATLTLKNPGYSSLTVDVLRINSATGELYAFRRAGTATWTRWATLTNGLTFNPGDVYEVCVRRSGGTAFTSGTKYEFVFQTTGGNNFPYTEYAPYS